jgi:hypothetical protein
VAPPLGCCNRPEAVFRQLNKSWQRTVVGLSVWGSDRLAVAGLRRRPAITVAPLLIRLALSNYIMAPDSHSSHQMGCASHLWNVALAMHFARCFNLSAPELSPQEFFCLRIAVGRDGGIAGILQFLFLGFADCKSLLDCHIAVHHCRSL